MNKRLVWMDDSWHDWADGEMLLVEIDDDDYNELEEGSRPHHLPDKERRIWSLTAEDAVKLIEAGKRSPEWLAQALNEGDGTYKP